MTRDSAHGHQILGDLQVAAGVGEVRIHDRYDTDIEDLWTAVVDPERLARWYGQVEGDLRPGGHFRLYIEASDIESAGQILTCDRPRRLKVTNRETDESHARGQGVPPFDAVIELTLAEVGAQTDLTIVVSGMPVEKIANYGAGWQIHAENLAAYLLGREPGSVGVRWNDLVPQYQDLATHLPGPNI